MACELCEFAEVGAGYEYYTRIGNGNVRLLGCEKHVKELIELVRYARTIQREHVGPDKGGSEFSNHSSTP